MKILFATDGSGDSETAARTLLALGPPSDSQVVVLYVMETPEYWATPAVPPPYYAEWHRVEHEIMEEAEEAADRAIEQGKQIFAQAGISADVMVAEGHPAEEILRTAGETGADLVVIGAKGRTGSKVFMLGGVAQKVMKYAPSSVFVTKPAVDPAVPRIAKVILAVDGSEHSIAAARLLSSFGLKEDSEVVVLHVQPSEPHWLLWSKSAQPALEQLRQGNREAAERLVGEATSHLITPARVTTSIRDGDPAEEILKATSELGADLVVMGSKGLGGLKLFLLGSVSQKVCRYSDRSVLLVKSRPTPASA